LPADSDDKNHSLLYRQRSIGYHCCPVIPSAAARTCCRCGPTPPPICATSWAASCRARQCSMCHRRMTRPKCSATISPTPRSMAGRRHVASGTRETGRCVLPVLLRCGRGRYADFHGLRHTCGSLLAASGAHPKVAQSIMRHSSIELTMQRYTHVFAGQEADAVAALPSLDASPIKQRARATGTDNMQAATNNVQATAASVQADPAPKRGSVRHHEPRSHTFRAKPVGI